MDAKAFAFAYILVVLCLAAGNVSAAPIYFADTEHYYERIDVDLSWYDAKAEAESRSYLEVSGHLATITSQAENDFIYDNFHGTRCWVGGYQPEESPEPDGGWTWVTGEPWEFEYWAGGEPNDLHGQEECLEIFSKVDGWNDYADSYTQPFIVEYPVGVIPEPATLSLVGLAALGLLLKKRR